MIHTHNSVHTKQSFFSRTMITHVAEEKKQKRCSKRNPSLCRKRGLGGGRGVNRVKGDKRRGMVKTFQERREKNVTTAIKPITFLGGRGKR